MPVSACQRHVVGAERHGAERRSREHAGATIHVDEKIQIAAATAELAGWRGETELMALPGQMVRETRQSRQTCPQAWPLARFSGSIPRSFAMFSPKIFARSSSVM